MTPESAMYPGTGCW